MVMAAPEAASKPAMISRQSRGISFDENVMDNQRPSDASSQAPEDDTGTSVGLPTEQRPRLSRSQTGDPAPRSVFPTKKPVQRSFSGNPKDAETRRAMMSQRAMSSRDFGGSQRAGRGLGTTTRNSGGGRGGGMASRSMSTRIMGAASDFTRMASTRALFVEEPEPSIIVYMGREIKVEDHFDDDWIEDALDEEAGMKSQSSQRMSTSSRRSQDSSRRSTGSQDGSRRISQNDTDNEVAVPHDSDSEVEEDMEEMDEDTSANDDSKRRRRRGSRQASQKTRSRSSDPAPTPRRPRPCRTVERSKTFDGRQTSEILPRRRKSKSRSARQLLTPKDDLNRQFQEFLSKTGGVTPTGNHRYQNGQQFTVDGIRRRQPKMPTSRKKVEQFRRLEYTAEDIQGVLCEDDDTFQRLKRVLTKKGAITNGVLQQRLHIFLKKAKDRQSKLKQQRKEEEGSKSGDEADNTTNLQTTQPDWAAMSMMDMFAQSVRKLTSDTDATSAAAAPTPAANGEEEFQRRPLPRMQAVMAKRNNMQDKKSSRTLMASFAEDEEEEESSNHDNIQEMSGSTGRSSSPFRRTPIQRPKSPAVPVISKRDSTSDNDMETDMNAIEPKELRVTRKPMELDLSHKFKESPPIARELPVTRSPMELDLTQNFKAALPVEPKCLDNEMAASQRPMELDMRQNFQDLPVQPKCLDDELSPSQRPMELDLSKNFQGELRLEPKCLDDLKADEKPMKLDLSGSGGRGPLLLEPKNLDNPEKVDEALLFEPKSVDGSSKMDGSRTRRRHRPSRIRNFSGTSKGSSSRGFSSKSATPTRDRARRSKSCNEVPPLKTPESRDSNGSAAKPATPGLLVGWNH